MTTPGEIRRQALAILESHWDAALQATLPHPLRYPHRWLWDSCFHAITWAALGRPEGLVELGSVLGSALPTVLGRGFLPHMVYGDPDRTGGGVDREPLAGMSSFTQPAVHALALSEIGERGFEPPPWMHRASADALAWLWGARLRDGLLTIAHPWESGQDISPRFDDWYDDPGFASFGEHYAKLVRTATYDAVGVAESNCWGVVAPAGFNDRGSATGFLPRFTHAPPSCVGVFWSFSERITSVEFPKPLPLPHKNWPSALRGVEGWRQTGGSATTQRWARISQRGSPRSVGRGRVRRSCPCS